jgi:hypothetical protein
MLEQFKQGTKPYYEAIKALTPAELTHEWQEITTEQYWYLLEVLPPEQMKANAFMVGECMTHTENGAVYEAVAQVDGRYFARPAYIQTFNPETYSAEIRAQFKL